jgi:hypothetical protein
MSNLIPFNGGAGVPAHLDSLWGDEANIAQRNGINALKFKGKVWRTYIDGSENDLMQDVNGDMVPAQIVNIIVLDHNKNRSRAFYEGGFEDGANKAPTCASSDGVKPDANIKEPCAQTCASCPNAVKGSKISDNGKPTTACSPNKRVAVVPVGGVGKHVPLLLRLAQTSVWDKDNAENEAQGWFAWDQYLDFLRARGAKHTAAVETRAKFDKRMAYPKLLFSASRWLNPDEAVAAKAMLNDASDEIAKILSGSGLNDGATGTPGIPSDGLPSIPGTQADTTKATKVAAATAAVDAIDAVAKAEAAKADAEAKAAAEVAAAEKARKKAAKEAKAKAAAEAAAAAAAAADDDDDDDDDGVTDVVAKPVAAAAPAAEPIAPQAGVGTESSTPDGLKSLLDGWDDSDE